MAFFALVVSVEAAGVALLWLPYYGIGKLRLARLQPPSGVIRSMDVAAWYPEIPEPHAAETLDAIALPECPNSDVPEAVWREVSPMLESIRTILREYPHLGARKRWWEAAPRYDRACRLLRWYLNWREFEMDWNTDFDAAAFVLDLNRISDYAREDPSGRGFLAGAILSGWSVMTRSHLATLPDGVLRQAAEYSVAGEERFRRRLTEAVWLEALVMGDKCAEMLWPYPIGDNVRATLCQYALERIQLLDEDYWRNHDAFEKLQRHYAGYGGIYRAILAAYVDYDLNAQVATRVVYYRLLRVLVACEEYRRKYGEYPETLAALTPGFLEAVPLDPFDGKPLRYDPGRMIYCVGADGVDDGGDIRTSTRDAGTKDIGFALPGGKPGKDVVEMENKPR